MTFEEDLALLLPVEGTWPSLPGFGGQIYVVESLILHTQKKSGKPYPKETFQFCQIIFLNTSCIKCLF